MCLVRLRVFHYRANTYSSAKPIISQEERPFHLTIAERTERACIIFVTEKNHTVNEVFHVEHTRSSWARSTHHVGIQVLEERVAETVARSAITCVQVDPLFEVL